GAQIEGDVSAEELTVGGYVKGTLHANRVTVNSTAVVKGDIFHRTLMIEGSDASMKSARAIVRWRREQGAGERRGEGMFTVGAFETAPRQTIPERMGFLRRGLCPAGSRSLRLR